jgi:hypothetical protein
VSFADAPLGGLADNEVLAVVELPVGADVLAVLELLAPDELDPVLLAVLDGVPCEVPLLPHPASPHAVTATANAARTAPPRVTFFVVIATPVRLLWRLASTVVAMRSSC